MLQALSAVLSSIIATNKSSPAVIAPVVVAVIATVLAPCEVVPELSTGVDVATPENSVQFPSKYMADWPVTVKVCDAPADVSCADPIVERPLVDPSATVASFVHVLLLLSVSVGALLVTSTHVDTVMIALFPDVVVIDADVTLLAADAVNLAVDWTNATAISMHRYADLRVYLLIALGCSPELIVTILLVWQLNRVCALCCSIAVLICATIPGNIDSPE